MNGNTLPMPLMMCVLQGTQGAAPLPFTVFGVIALVAGGVVWLLPETRGNTPQIDDIYDLNN